MLVPPNKTMIMAAGFVREVGHLLVVENGRNDPLSPMPVGELISHLQGLFQFDLYLYELPNSAWEVAPIINGIDVYLRHLSSFTSGHSKGMIPG